MLIEKLDSFDDKPFLPVVCLTDSHPCLPSFVTEAFVEAMEKFGFSGLNAIDIVNTGKVVREEIAVEDPERAAAL